MPKWLQHYRKRDRHHLIMTGSLQMGNQRERGSYMQPLMFITVYWQWLFWPVYLVQLHRIAFFHAKRTSKKEQWVWISGLFLKGNTQYVLQYLNEAIHRLRVSSMAVSGWKQLVTRKWGNYALLLLCNLKPSELLYWKLAGRPFQI